MAALTTTAAAAAVGAEDIDFGAEAQARGMELVSCIRVRGGGKRNVYGYLRVDFCGAVTTFWERVCVVCVRIVVVVSCRSSARVPLACCEPQQDSVPAVPAAPSARRPPSRCVCATRPTRPSAQKRRDTNLKSSWLLTHVPKKLRRVDGATYMQHAFALDK